MWTCRGSKKKKKRREAPEVVIKERGGGFEEACSDRVEACGACEQISVAPHCRDKGEGEEGGVQEDEEEEKELSF